MRDIHPFRLVIEDLPAVEQLTPEEMARIFGAGKTSFTRLGLEPLEERLALTWGAVPPAVLVPLGPGRLGALRVGVQTPTNTPARISIWIDYNQDGDFGDAGEQIANDGFVVGPSALTYSSYGVEVSVPPGAATGFT